MKKYYLLVCLLIFNIVSVNAEDNADVKIKNAISDYLANNFLNATFVFCNDDGVVEIGAKGFHRLYDQYLKAKQKMPVASITKTITAAGILRLRDKKLLNISDSVAKLLPSDSGVWKDGKVPSWANKVTLHHLLTHTSGLTEYFMNMPINLEQTHQQINMDITEFVANKKLKFTPGAKYEYVNTNYVIAGLIIETISKQPLIDFFCEEFFQPLGMRYTKLASLEEAVKFQQDPSSTEYPTRYFVTPADKPQFNEATADYIMIPYADGGVISNITDLILWHKALHNGKILSPSSYKLMTTKHYKQNSNTYSLDNVILDLYNITKHDKDNFSSNLFQKIAKPYVGRSITAEISKFIDKGETIDLAELIHILPIEKSVIGRYDPGFDMAIFDKEKVIRNIKKTSNAYKAGLRDGDIIVQHSFWRNNPNKAMILKTKDKTFRFKPVSQDNKVIMYQIKKNLSPEEELAIKQFFNVKI